MTTTMHAEFQTSYAADGNDEFIVFAAYTIHFSTGNPMASPSPLPLASATDLPSLSFA
jgi:hypothetical protein